MSGETDYLDRRADTSDGIVGCMMHAQPCPFLLHLLRHCCQVIRLPGEYLRAALAKWPTAVRVASCRQHVQATTRVATQQQWRRRQAAPSPGGLGGIIIHAAQ